MVHSSGGAAAAAAHQRLGPGEWAAQVWEHAGEHSPHAWCEISHKNPHAGMKMGLGASLFFTAAALLCAPAHPSCAKPVSPCPTALVGRKRPVRTAAHGSAGAAERPFPTAERIPHPPTWVC